MSQIKDQQRSRRVSSPVSPTAGVEEQGDSLLGDVQGQLVEQASLLEATALEAQYSASFEALVEAKHDQVERLEDKLESLIENHSAKLQSTRSSQPRLLSLPGAQARWRQDVVKGEAVMQRLHERLEAVREIKDGMGLHSSRIEELAERKLRAQEPMLAKNWDDMMEAQRLHVMLQRKLEQDKRRALSLFDAPGQGRRLDFP